MTASSTMIMRTSMRLRSAEGQKEGDVQVTREWGGQDRLRYRLSVPSTRGSSELQAGHWLDSPALKTATVLPPLHTSRQPKSQAIGQDQATMRRNLLMVIQNQPTGLPEGRRRRDLHIISQNHPMRNLKRQMSMGLQRHPHHQATKNLKRRMSMGPLRPQQHQAIMKRLRRNMAHHRPLWLHMPNQMKRRMSTDPPKLQRLVTLGPRPPMRPPNPTTQPHHTSRSLSISRNQNTNLNLNTSRSRSISPNQNLLTSPADHLTSPNPSTNLDPSTSPNLNTNLSPVTSLNHLTSQSHRTNQSHPTSPKLLPMRRRRRSMGHRKPQPMKSHKKLMKSHHHLMNLLLQATKSQHPLMKSQQICPLTKQSLPTALQRPTNPILISQNLQDLMISQSFLCRTFQT